MPQNKRQIKLTTILLLTIIVIFQFFLISLAKTEVYFSLYDDPETVIIKNINKAGQELPYFFTTTIEVELEKEIININTAFLENFIQVLGVSEHTAKRIIELRDKLGEFKEPQGLTQLPEITNLEWEEWEEEGVTITINC
ncbi:hypothetical protein ES695_18950 [Candidatus Atribacteria bacterium 1244-E10-H5-B2]|nr:MAG: hypothetical protein ES695_18950 [Candidatus Atribacteria bacterium 1244-E10-H5-B2]